MKKDTVKKLLSALAGTVGIVFATEATYNAATGVDVIPGQVDHILGVAGIVLGILGASPIGRIIFAEPDDK